MSKYTNASITSTIEKYIEEIPKDEFHRYKSWDYCFKAFAVEKPTEYLALQLGFFLASWGMYRGSGGLLKKNHLIHQKAVDILFSPAFKKIKCSAGQDVSSISVIDILKLKEELAIHYKKAEFINSKGKSKQISTTDTLISKIMLGTMGCVPAYDRYFIEGLKTKNIKQIIFNSNSLDNLLHFIEANKNELSDCQYLIRTKIQTHYPLMKILDMYFWQLGFSSQQNKSIKAL